MTRKIPKAWLLPTYKERPQLNRLQHLWPQEAAIQSTLDGNTRVPNDRTRFNHHNKHRSRVIAREIQPGQFEYEVPACQNRICSLVTTGGE